MNTKLCCKCRQSRPVDQFNWKDRSKGTLYSYCKPCWNELNKDRYEKNKGYYIEKAHRRKSQVRQWLLRMKAEKGCSSCDESHPACLEFHHLDPESKLFDVSDAVLTRSKAKIDAEIAKCAVLCCNCHNKLHFKLRGGVWPSPAECDGFARSPAETEEEVRLL